MDRNSGEEIPQKDVEQTVASNPHASPHHADLQMSHGDQCHGKSLNQGE